MIPNGIVLARIPDLTTIRIAPFGKSEAELFSSAISVIVSKSLFEKSKPEN